MVHLAVRRVDGDPERQLPQSILPPRSFNFSGKPQSHKKIQSLKNPQPEKQNIHRSGLTYYGKHGCSKIKIQTVLWICDMYQFLLTAISKIQTAQTENFFEDAYEGTFKDKFQIWRNFQ